MQAYKCDRCGRLFEGASLNRIDYYDHSNDDEWREGTYDLCPDCVGALGRWLDNEPSKTMDLAWDLFVSLMTGSSQLNNLCAKYLPRLRDCGIDPDVDELMEYTDFSHYEDTYRRVKKMMENGEL